MRSALRQQGLQPRDHPAGQAGDGPLLPQPALPPGEPRLRRTAIVDQAAQRLKPVAGMNRDLGRLGIEPVCGAILHHGQKPER